MSKNKEDIIKELQAIIEQQKIALSRATTTKTVSEVFVNAKNNEYITYKHLSETKKYFEANHFDLLEKLKAKCNVESFTSETLHKALVSILQEVL